MTQQFTNLAFKGGGVLGIAYAGALEVLEEQQILQNVQRVAGTSAGAITAALVSLRCTAAEIYQAVQSTNFGSFEDGFDPLRIATKYGLYKGDAFLSWMQQQITSKGLPATATFSDFKAKGLPDLRVFATDLNIRGLKEFSVETTPGTIVAEAVRASMSIPLFFEAWQFSNSVPDNHIYVDGGTVFNFPITAFDSGNAANPQTLGFYLENLHAAPVDDGLTDNHILKYVGALFETLLDAQVIDFENNPGEESRSIIIDNLGISPVNFNLTDDQKTQLYNSGKQYTTAYLSRFN
jgi:NTE family protein